MKKLYLSLFSFFFIFTNNLIAKEVSTSEITDTTQALTNTCTQTTILGIKQVTGIKDGVPFTKTNHCSKNGKNVIRFTCDSTTNTYIRKINDCELGCNNKTAKCIKNELNIFSNDDFQIIYSKLEDGSMPDKDLTAEFKQNAKRLMKRKEIILNLTDTKEIETALPKYQQNNAQAIITDVLTIHEKILSDILNSNVKLNKKISALELNYNLFLSKLTSLNNLINIQKTTDKSSILFEYKFLKHYFLSDNIFIFYLKKLNAKYPDIDIKEIELKNFLQLNDMNILDAWLNTNYKLSIFLVSLDEGEIVYKYGYKSDFSNELLFKGDLAQFLGSRISELDALLSIIDSAIQSIIKSHDGLTAYELDSQFGQKLYKLYYDIKDTHLMSMYKIAFPSYFESK